MDVLLEYSSERGSWQTEGGRLGEGLGTTGLEGVGCLL